MKILIISDSHGNLRSIDRVLKQQENVDMIFHLGDNVRDALEISKRVSCPLHYVKGNTDFVEAPIDLIKEICGKRFYITHGHKYGIKTNLDRLYYAALERQADVVLFGHSHIPFHKEIEGVLFFNPGSVGDKRWEPNESYGIIEIDDTGNVEAQIIKLV